MIKRQYTGEQRRALNIIWNAAGRYDFDPPFMAFDAKGKADPYFCMVIGLAAKWFDLTALTGYFDKVERFARADEMEDLLWIGIENAVYEKEIGERPVLKNLRKERASLFFLQSGNLSRQQMMLQSMLTLTQQEARWAHVLDRPVRTITAREKRMAEDLRFPGSLDTNELMSTADEFLASWFHVRSSDKKKEILPYRQRDNLPGVFRALLGHETRERDSLVTRTGSGAANSGGSLILAHERDTIHTSEEAKKDLAYIRACYGESILSEQDLKIVTGECAVGADAGCAVYVTKGPGTHAGIGGNHFDDMRATDRNCIETDRKTVPDIRKASRKEKNSSDLSASDRRDIVRVHADRKDQREKNVHYLKEHTREIRSLTERLAASLAVVFESYAEPLPETGRAGKLASDRAYRLSLLQDPDVFLHPGDEKVLDLSVELLLDASASRMKHTEEIAAESVMIAGALGKCHVPVAVTAFSSLRGFTVLTVLKDWNEMTCDRIADFYAGGWNRDSLAIRTDTILRLNGDSHARKLLLILTDAAPNDSAKILPDPDAAGFILPREYEGEPAVQATAAAVKKVREAGIHAAAVYTGSTVHLENLYRIYGKEYVRIGKLSQLTDAVAELIRMTLQENENLDKERRA